MSCFSFSVQYLHCAVFEFCYFSLRALSCRTVEKFLLCFLLVRESDRTHKKCFGGADYTIFLFRYISKILFGLLGTGSVCMCLAATNWRDENILYQHDRWYKLFFRFDSL